MEKIMGIFPKIQPNYGNYERGTQAVGAKPFVNTGAVVGPQPKYENYELTPNLQAGDRYFTNNPDKSKNYGKTTLMYMG